MGAARRGERYVLLGAGASIALGCATRKQVRLGAGGGIIRRGRKGTSNARRRARCDARGALTEACDCRRRGGVTLPRATRAVVSAGAKCSGGHRGHIFERVVR